MANCRRHSFLGRARLDRRHPHGHAAAILAPAVRRRGVARRRGLRAPTASAAEPLAHARALSDVERRPTVLERVAQRADGACRRARARRAIVDVGPSADGRNVGATDQRYAVRRTKGGGAVVAANVRAGVSL